MRPLDVRPLLRLGTRPLGAGALAALTVFAAAVLSGGALYQRAARALRDELRAGLVRTAATAARFVDGDGHRRFTDRSQETSPEYARALRPLERILHASGDIRYIYTCVLVRGQVCFVLDPTPAGDADHDGIDDKSHIMQPYPDATPEMLRALRTGRIEAERQPSRDQWGSFISAYAPLRDHTGRQVGIVGVDMTAEQYLKRLARMRHAAAQALGIALLLSLGIGGSVVLLCRASATAHAAQQRAADLLTVQKQLLEMAALGLPLSHFFATLCSLLEERLPGVAGCVLLGDPEPEVPRLEAAPSLPEAFGRALERCLAGPSEHLPWRRSWSRQQLAGLAPGQHLVVDLSTDPAWKELEEDARRHGFPSGWVLPLSTAGSPALGLLALFCRERRAPRLPEIELAGTLARVAGIALERQRAEAELSAANARLAELSITDGLTGVRNRRYFYERLQAHYSLAVRQGLPLSVIMLDVDQFKQYNDAFGHPAGDEVLRRVARALRGLFRDHDEVARYGGEEFAILLPGTGREGGMTAAERCREAIERQPWPLQPITASFGVATLGLATPDAATLVAEADQALYFSKARGRRCVSHFQEVVAAVPTTSEGVPDLQVGTPSKLVSPRGESTIPDGSTSPQVINHYGVVGPLVGSGSS